MLRRGRVVRNRLDVVVMTFRSVDLGKPLSTRTSRRTVRFSQSKSSSRLPFRRKVVVRNPKVYVTKQPCYSLRKFRRLRISLILQTLRRSNVDFTSTAFGVCKIRCFSTFFHKSQNSCTKTVSCPVDRINASSFQCSLPLVYVVYDIPRQCVGLFRKRFSPRSG